MSLEPQKSPNFAAQLSATINDCVNDFFVNGGLSIDAYFDEPCFHPMADAKYLSSLSVLFVSKKISASFFEKHAEQAIDRLMINSIKLENGCNAWGLGFKYRNSPATEPYLITTAIVCDALGSAVMAGIESDLAAMLLESAKNGLQYWINKMTVEIVINDYEYIDVPVFSPNIKESIFNVVIYAIATLDRVDLNNGNVKFEYQKLIEWVKGYHLPKLGWPYSPDNHRVDLLHQVYILNSFANLYGVESIEEKAIEMAGQFKSIDGYVDAGDVHKEVEALFNKKIPAIRAVGDIYFEVIPKPARLWSLGELLVLVSRLADEGLYHFAWLSYGRKLSVLIIEHLNSGNEETKYARHTMHALHGLACFLAVIRKSRNGVS